MTTYLTYKFYAAGFCTHLECITLRGSSWSPKTFPALCCLIKHPTQGYILYDTGYSDRFYQATKQWPFCLYRKITPVNLSPSEPLVEQLKNDGISPEDIRTIIISHFHADHIGGLRDFPRTKFICSQLAYDSVKGQKGMKALRKGYLAPLLPDDFEKRTSFSESFNSLRPDVAYTPFQEAYDLFGDGQLLGVPLPGHAHGQLGLIFGVRGEKPVFLVADSCWSSIAYKQNILPSRLTALVHDNWQDYKKTLSKIHSLSQMNPMIRIVPSHCSDVALNLTEGGDV